MIIRKISQTDNILIADVIKKVMYEFNGDPNTTILGDPTLNAMFENYQEPRAIYYIVEINNVVAGGCGIKQLEGEKEEICELQRLFLSAETRGIGIGKQLLDICLTASRVFHYRQMYLETLSQMTKALSLYTATGFKKINTPLGNTGHSGCNVYMLKEIN